MKEEGPNSCRSSFALSEDLFFRMLRVKTGEHQRRDNLAVEYDNNSSRSSLRPRSPMTFATAALMDRSLLTYCHLFTVSVFLYGPNSAATCVTFTQVWREQCRAGPLGNKVILGSQRLSLLCWVSVRCHLWEGSLF